MLLALFSHESRMCAKYGFEKPNDRRALDLMNTAAKAVVSDLPDITLAYGVSDEYRYLLAPIAGVHALELTEGRSFIFHKSTNLFERRARSAPHFQPSSDVA